MQPRCVGEEDPISFEDIQAGQGCCFNENKDVARGRCIRYDGMIQGTPVLAPLEVQQVEPWSRKPLVPPQDRAACGGDGEVSPQFPPTARGDVPFTVDNVLNVRAPRMNNVCAVLTINPILASQGSYYKTSDTTGSGAPVTRLNV